MPGGWVGGGWGKAENKGKLSPAGAGSWAELGNIRLSQGYKADTIIYMIYYVLGFLFVVYECVFQTHDTNEHF